MLGADTAEPRLVSETTSASAATADLASGLSTPAPGRGTRYEVEALSRPASGFDSLAELRDTVLTGTLSRLSRVRTVIGADDGTVTEGPWTTIDAMAKRHTELRAVYRPVWDHTMRFVSYGMIAGCVIKGLDTSVLIFSMDPGLGVAWLVVVAALLASSRWPMAPLFAAFLCFKVGIAANFFMTALGVIAVGCALGAPAGMLIGTLVGHLRRDRLPVAPDADPEGVRPYLLGAVLPGIGLAVAIPFYLRFSVKALEWISR